MDSVGTLQIKSFLWEAINLGIFVTHVVMGFQVLVCITGTSWPVAAVLSGSMEPGFTRGNVLFLSMTKDPIRIGEVVVFEVDGKNITVVHRVIRVHERHDNGEVDILTKGDKNRNDDRFLYPYGQLWLQRHHIIGRAVGIVPYAGRIAIIMFEKPKVQYILFSVLGLLYMIVRE